MSISFSCPTCRRKYNVPEGLAGKRRRCAGCGEILTVPPVAPPPSPPPPASRARASEVVDLGDAEEIPPPPPPRRSPSQFGAQRPKPPRAVDFPTQRPIAASPLISESAAKMVSALLILGVIAASVWLSIRLGSQATDRNALPDDLRSRFHAYIALIDVWTLVLYFVLFTPAVLVASLIGVQLFKRRLPDAAYLRSAGALAPAYLLLFFAATQPNLRGNVAALLSLGSLSLVMLFFALWLIGGIDNLLAALVATVMTAVFFLVIGFIVKPLTPIVAGACQKMVGIDADSLRQWAKDNPDKVRAMREARYGSAAGGGGGGGSNVGGGSPAAPDPLTGKIEPLLKDLNDANTAARRQTREQIQPTRERLAKQLEALKPAESSLLYARAESALSRLATEEAEAPSETPPAEVFQAAPSTPLPMTKASDVEFAPEWYAFKSLRVRPLRDVKVDLKSYDDRDRVQRWELSRFATIEITYEPLKDPKQQRPWVADRDAIGPIADQKNLLAVIVTEKPEASSGQLNGLGWTRVAKTRPGGGIAETTYVARLTDAWAIVKLSARGLRQDDIEAADKFVQGIRLTQPGDAPALDPFAPEQVVERIGDTFGDDPSPILRAAGAKGLSALVQYAARLGDRTPSRARALMDELARSQPTTGAAQQVAVAPGPAGRAIVGGPGGVVRPGAGGIARAGHGAAAVAPAASPADVKAALTMLRTAGSTFDKRSAIQVLAVTPPAPPGDPLRDEVASALEGAMTGEQAFFLGADAANALANWWRPQTVTVLMPLLDEHVFPPSKREAAMRVLGKTQDRRAVFPIIRWIIKDPENTVAALTEIGPVAEDEVVKLLRNNDAKVRANAARILDTIGSQKCLIELRRASNDPRDPSAAAVAKAAVDSVMARVKASKPATPAATRPAATRGSIIIGR
jgi:HEAT repeat protein